MKIDRADHLQISKVTNLKKEHFSAARRKTSQYLSPNSKRSSEKELCRPFKSPTRAATVVNIKRDNSRVNLTSGFNKRRNTAFEHITSRYSQSRLQSLGTNCSRKTMVNSSLSMNSVKGKVLSLRESSTQTEDDRSRECPNCGQVLDTLKGFGRQKTFLSHKTSSASACSTTRRPHWVANWAISSTNLLDEPQTEHPHICVEKNSELKYPEKSTPLSRSYKTSRIPKLCTTTSTKNENRNESTSLISKMYNSFIGVYNKKGEATKRAASSIFSISLSDEDGKPGNTGIKPSYEEITGDNERKATGSCDQTFTSNVTQSSKTTDNVLSRVSSASSRLTTSSSASYRGSSHDMNGKRFIRNKYLTFGSINNVSDSLLTPTMKADRMFRGLPSHVKSCVKRNTNNVLHRSAKSSCGSTSQNHRSTRKTITSTSSSEDHVQQVTCSPYRILNSTSDLAQSNESSSKISHSGVHNHREMPIDASQTNSPSVTQKVPTKSSSEDTSASARHKCKTNALTKPCLSFRLRMFDSSSNESISTQLKSQMDIQKNVSKFKITNPEPCENRNTDSQNTSSVESLGNVGGSTRKSILKHTALNTTREGFPLSDYVENCKGLERQHSDFGKCILHTQTKKHLHDLNSFNKDGIVPKALEQPDRSLVMKKTPPNHFVKFEGDKLRWKY